MSFRDRRQKCIDVVMMQEPARARVDPKSQGGPDKRAPGIGWAAETLSQTFYLQAFHNFQC